MMNFYRRDEAFTYDDVLLVPQKSDIATRSSISELTDSGNKLGLAIPIISANMDTVTESNMAIAMYKAGGLGIFHRYMPMEKLMKEVDKFRAEIPEGQKRNRTAMSAGSNTKMDAIGFAMEVAKTICVDVAHGHSDQTAKLVEFIRKEGPKDLIIIAGNVATAEGCKFLVGAGADIVKVGIGGGSLCTTRLVTGHGYPQLSAVEECATLARDRGFEIIADGGVRYAGDVAKALAVGAHYVMLGGMLAATSASPGEVEYYDGRSFKRYRGMASFDAQAAMGKENIVPEGASQLKPYQGKTEDVLQKVVGGLRSALSYSGAHNLEEFRQKAMFIRVTPSSFVEGTPHGLKEGK